MDKPRRPNRATRPLFSVVAAEWLVLAAVVGLAIFLRVYLLDTVPTGLLYDEAYNGLDIVSILGGARPIFLPANYGREALFPYLQALSVSIVGSTDWALRIPSAIVGVLTLPTSFLLIRRLYGRRVAILTCGWLGLSLWHVTFSRIGLRTIVVPLVLSTSFYCLWRGLERVEGEADSQINLGKRLRRWSGAPWFVAAGTIIGVAQYTYPTARLAPLVVVALAGFLAITNREAFRRALPGLVCAAVIAAAVFAPEGVYFLRHPNAFTSRANDVSIFNSALNGGDLTAALVYSTTQSLEMFFVHGDDHWDRNISGRPIFDPLSSAVGALGLILVLRRARDVRYAFLIAWIAIMLIPSAISIRDVPDFLRVTGLIPAVFALPALGADWLWGIWDARTSARLEFVPIVAVSLAVAVGAALTFRDYFDTWAHAPEVNQVFNADRWVAIETARNLVRSTSTSIYVGGGDRDEPLQQYELYGRHPSDGFLLFNGENSLVLPPRGVAATYLFAPRDLPPNPIRDRYFPDGAGQIVARTPSGEAVTRWDLSASRLSFQPDHPVATQLGRDFEVFGLDVPRDVRAGDDFTVRAYWTVLATDSREIYFAVQLLDSANRRQGQVDQRALAPGYWAPGTPGISSLHFKIDPNTPTGAYSVVFGAYLRQDLTRLPVIDVTGREAGGQIDLGLVKVHGVPFPNPVTASPQAAVLNDQIGFIRADLQPSPIRPGDKVTATIYWSARGRPTTDYTVFVHVLDPNGHVVAGGDAPPRAGRYPTSVWDTGETIVDAHDLMIDPGVKPGTYQLEVGMYVPRTGQRLPVLGINGQVVGDRILVPGVVVDAS